MNKEETIKLFGLIHSLYPREEAFRNADMPMVNAWLAMLKDLPFDAVCTAVKAHTAQCPFSPSIADIRKQVVNLSENRMQGAEAWGFVIDAVRRFGYLQQGKAEESMPADVWKFTKRFGYKDICMTENIDVVRGQFIRAWDNESQAKADTMQLPMSVREIIQGVKLLND